MSKIDCVCGNLISDNTDFISYKAQFIADQDYFDLLDEIENKSFPEHSNSFGRYAQEIFQCSSCRNVIFLRQDKRVDFQPLNKEESIDVLKSRFAENWKGVISANFRDGFGEIFWQTNVDSGYRTKLSLEKLREIYHEKFAELKTFEILRSSFLRVDGLIEHDFEFEK